MKYALEIASDIRKYQAEIAKIPGMTEAQAAKAALALETRMNRAQEAAAKTAQKAASQAGAAWQAANAKAAATGSLGAGKGLENLERGAGKAKESVASLASALTMLDPRLGAIATSGSAAVGVLKGMAGAASLSLAALGPVAVAAAALGGVYLLLKSRLKEAEEAQKAASDEAERAQRIFGGLSDVMRGLEDDVRLATGQIDELGLQLERRLGKINSAYDAAEGELREKLSGLRRERAELDAEERKATTEWVEADRQNRSAMAATEKQLTSLNQKRTEAIATADLLVDHERGERRARDESAEAARRHAEALRRAAEARAREEEAARAAMATLQAELGAREALIAISGELRATGMTDEEKLLSAYRAKLRAIEETRRSAGKTADVEAEAQQARLEADEWYAREATKLEEKRASEAKAIRDREAAEAQQRADRQIALERSVAYAKMDLASASFGLVQTLAQIAQQEQGQGALQAFRIAQAAALAQIAISTVVAAAKAMELGFPLGPIAAAAAGITGAAQMAQVASQSPPSWYTGLEYADPRGQPAILHPGEAVLSRTGASTLGRDTIRDANRGRTPASPTVIETVLEGRYVAHSVAREVRRGGTLQAELTRRTGRLGHYPGRAA